MRARTVLLGWLGAFALTTGCGSLFGVDFDDARLGDFDGDGGPPGNEGGPGDDGNGGDGGPSDAGKDSPSHEPPVDGGCASPDRVLCGSSCVLRSDPAYGCGSCTACPLPSGAVATTCSGSSCSFTCPIGKKPKGNACVAKTWVGKQAAPHDIRGIWGSAKNDIYFVGYDGIYHSDGTGTWTAQSSQPKPNIAMGSNLMGLSAQSILAIGQGAPYRLASPGNWTPWNALGTCGTSQSLWAVNINDIYAVAKDTICHSKNGGAFVAKTNRPGDLLNAVWASSTGKIFAVGSGDNDPGVIYASTGNDVWDSVGTAPGTLYGIWGIGTEVYAMGLGVIMRSFNGGDFIQQGTSPGVTIYGMWGSSPSDLYAVGRGGTVLHSTNGSVWDDESPSNANAVDFYSVWGSGADDVYAAGSGGWIFHLE